MEVRNVKCNGKGIKTCSHFAKKYLLILADEEIKLKEAPLNVILYSLKPKPSLSPKSRHV